ncbi:hypothetical protein OIE66_10595 [Nonomuraea sp. NBC_01738]|uniref:hypothetical protein n=1 Tax=Nonomuraea sp. NBC_01738 TaxID=2976003 RepID=UPI002E0E59F6|nr:hypothetical protein OIE66_10595 [Nonomuraea sp. NBC_01738]
MARNGFDDAIRRGTVGAEAVEGLLAYASTRSRWGGGALKNAREAVEMSRTLAAADPPAYTPLLARALRTSATLLLRRRRPARALPAAQESVALARAAGGAPLIVSLACLADVLTALHRYGEAAEAMAEAAEITE